MKEKQRPFAEYLPGIGPRAPGGPTIGETQLCVCRAPYRSACDAGGVAGSRAVGRHWGRSPSPAWWAGEQGMRNSFRDEGRVPRVNERLVGGTERERWVAK